MKYLLILLFLFGVIACGQKTEEQPAMEEQAVEQAEGMMDSSAVDTTMADEAMEDGDSQ